MSATNQLKMPLAQWLYHMYEAGLPSAARMLAVYAAAFKISNNDELRTLAGLAESTYATHKRTLLKDGWVIVSRNKGGRGIGIEVTPAYKETPVKFTDVSARDPSKFEAENPPENNPPYEEDKPPSNSPPISKITPLNSSDAPSDEREITPVNSDPLSPRADIDYARSDSINNINKNNPLDNYPKRVTTPRAPSRANDFWQNQLNPQNPDYQLDGDGLVTLQNGVKQRWLEDFGGDEKRLDLALKEISIQRSSQRSVASQVEAQLARIVGKARDQDKRYAAAAKAGGSKRGRGAPMSTEAIDRIYAKALALGGQPEEQQQPGDNHDLSDR